MSRTSKTGVGVSDYVDFENGEYNVVYIGSTSWGSGTATLMYSPDGVLAGAPLQYSNLSGVVVSSNTAVEIRSYDGKLAVSNDVDTNLVVTLDVKGQRNPYN